MGKGFRWERPSAYTIGGHMTDEQAIEMFRKILAGYEQLTVEACDEVNAVMGFDLGEKIRRCLPEHGGKGQIDWAQELRVRGEIFHG